MQDYHSVLIGISDEELLALAPGATHQHYKGGLYRLDGNQALHTETEESLTIYEHIYPYEPHRRFARPSTMWQGKATKEQPAYMDMKDNVRVSAVAAKSRFRRLKGSIAVGDKVRKRKGYDFSGTVISVFFTLAGKPRYVVESTVPGAAGMLHIFAGSNLELV